MRCPPAARAAVVAATALAGVAAQRAPGDLEGAWRANNVGVALLEQFRAEEAVASFRKALAAADRPIFRANLAIALLNVPRMDEARAEAEAAARAAPELLHAYYVLGLAARATGAAEDARAAFQRVLERDPADVGALVNLGQLHMQAQRYDDAARAFRAAAEAEPVSATAAYNLGLALARAGQAEESRKALARFQELKDAGYGTTLGQAYPEQGRYAEAIVSTGTEPELVDPAASPARFVDITASAVPSGPSFADGAIALADLDGDGRLDLVVVGSGGQRVYRREGDRFADVTSTWGLPPAPGGVGAVAADLDNDEKADVLILRTSGVSLLRNEGGRFADGTAAAGLDTNETFAAAALSDVDHDGDLDLVLAGAAVRLFQNDGSARFKDTTAAAGLTGGAGVTAILPTDYDNRRDVDLLFAGSGGVRLFRNERDGTFRDVAAPSGLDVVGASLAVAAGDVNKDGFTDLYLTVAGAPGRLAVSDRKGGFAIRLEPPGEGARAQLVDYDNDGLLDVLTVGASGPRLFRNRGRDWPDVTAAAFGGASWTGTDAPAALASADLDGDGDTDLALLTRGGALRVLDNQGGRHGSLAIRLAGLVSNRSGVGSKVELRAGSLRQRFETYAASPAPAPADVLFGLGGRESADAVRVLWPSGTLQAELVAAGTRALAIKELDRKPSSCPYLYAWNGRRFEFVTDFLGGGEMGYWQAPGRFNTPDRDEYVRIAGNQLVPRDHRLKLRVTNELEEALFLDRFTLLTVTHPADVEVFPEEGLRSTPPPFRLHALRDLRPPRGARDDHGHDVLDRLRALDRRFVDDFALERIRGYAEEHALVLDLGPEAAEDAALLLTGWTDYAFSSDNVAAHQAGLAMAPPRLETEDARGNWTTAVPEVGIPVGRPQTLVVPLRNAWRSASRRVRIVTSMRIYWDQAQVGALVAAPIQTALLEPVHADLRERGFSAAISPDGREPWSYDYERVSRSSPWKVFPGRYTRPGDVRELLAAADDLFVISPPGDEVALSFDARALPALPAGWTRTYILHAEGYSKEMDVNSASPHQLEPLPYRAMPGYPYAPPDAYPLTPERRAVRERYNTRVVRAPMAALDHVLAPRPDLPPVPERATPEAGSR